MDWEWKLARSEVIIAHFNWCLPKGLWYYRLIRPRIRGAFWISECTNDFAEVSGASTLANLAPCHVAPAWNFGFVSGPCRFWPVIWPVLAWKNIATFWKPPEAVRLQYLFAPTYWPTKSRNCGPPPHNVCPAIFFWRIFKPNAHNSQHERRLAAQPCNRKHQPFACGCESARKNFLMQCAPQIWAFACHLWQVPICHCIEGGTAKKAAWAPMRIYVTFN